MTTTTQNDIQPKPRTNRGTVYNFKNDPGAVFNAEINKTSIRIFGVYTNHVNGPQQFDKVLKVDDEVVFDSFNLVYTGRIVKIGPKSITILDSCSKRNKRLDLFVFIRRNWNLDLDKINKRNSEWMD